MHRVMLPRGHRMCFDHARLMLTLVAHTEGGEMLTCPLVMQ